MGVVFYELITGQKPYSAETPAAVLRKQLIDPLPRAGLLVPGLPEMVEKVLFKAMAKKPEDRYPNMAEFALALERLVKQSDMRDAAPPLFLEKTALHQGPSVSKPPAGSPPKVSDKTTDELQPKPPVLPGVGVGSGKPPVRRKGFPWVWLVVGFVLLLLLAICLPLAGGLLGLFSNTPWLSSLIPNLAPASTPVVPIATILPSPTETQLAVVVPTDTLAPTPTAEPSATATPVPLISQSFSVSAKSSWQTPKINIHAGDTLEITYLSGKWTDEKAKKMYYDALGNPSYKCSNYIAAAKCVEPVPDANGGSLVGRVGMKTPFFVGNYLKMVSPNDGPLLLMINDGQNGLYDNDGSVEIQINIWPK